MPISTIKTFLLERAPNIPIAKIKREKIITCSKGTMIYLSSLFLARTIAPIIAAKSKTDATSKGKMYLV